MRLDCNRSTLCNSSPAFVQDLQPLRIIHPNLCVLLWPTVDATLSCINRACVANDAGDYADLISYSVALLLKPHIQEHSHKFSHILVDEFQVGVAGCQGAFSFLQCTFISIYQTVVEHQSGPQSLSS